MGSKGMTTRGRTIAVLGMHIGAVAIAGGVLADEVPEGYLPGSWAVGSAEACAAGTGERLTFGADGAFSGTLHGSPTAAGFWQRDEDLLMLHMVASPAFFDDPATDADDALAAHAGQYSYYFARGLMFDIEPDAFRVVATMGDQMQGANLFRCP